MTKNWQPTITKEKQAILRTMHVRKMKWMHAGEKMRSHQSKSCDNLNCCANQEKSTRDELQRIAKHCKQVRNDQWKCATKKNESEHVWFNWRWLREASHKLDDNVCTPIGTQWECHVLWCLVIGCLNILWDHMVSFVKCSTARQSEGHFELSNDWGIEQDWQATIFFSWLLLTMFVLLLMLLQHRCRLNMPHTGCSKCRMQNRNDFSFFLLPIC